MYFDVAMAPLSQRTWASILPSSICCIPSSPRCLSLCASGSICEAVVVVVMVVVFIATSVAVGGAMAVGDGRWCWRSHFEEGGRSYVSVPVGPLHDERAAVTARLEGVLAGCECAVVTTIVVVTRGVLTGGGAAGTV